MAKITIDNSFCKIEGLTPSQEEMVKDLLTYEDDQVKQSIIQNKRQLYFAHNRGLTSKVAYLSHQIKLLEQYLEVCWYRDGTIPTGHLELISGALREHFGPDSVKLIDTRKKPRKTEKFEWVQKPMTPRYYQAEMIPIGLSEHRGVFEAAVGSGKTFVMMSLIKELKTPTLVIIPAKDLAGQTVSVFQEFLGKKAAMLLTSTSLDKPLAPIRVTTIQTLKAIQKKGLVSNILKDVGMVCIDEFHHAGADSYTSLMKEFNSIYYRFGFTGTYLRNDSKTLDMWGLLSKRIYHYSASKATQDGFLTPLKIITHEIPGILSKSYPTEYKKNYCGNHHLLRKIAEILQQLDNNESVLILVKQKEEGGSLIQKYLEEKGIPSTFISGDSKRSEVKEILKAFNEKQIKILIGSTIIGEGIDIKSTDHLIMAQGGKSEIAITQAIGRAVRLYPNKKVAYLHDFRMLDTKYMEKHWLERYKIYKRNFDGEDI